MPGKIEFFGANPEDIKQKGSTLAPLQDIEINGQKLIDRVYGFWRDGYESSQYYREEITDNLGFYTGRGHWTESQQIQADVQNRPLISINQVFKYMNLMSGLQIQTRLSPKAIPVGRGADPLIADIFSIAIDDIIRETEFHYEASDAYMMGQIADRSYLQWRVSYDTIWPKIQVVALDPRDVIEDPGALSATEDGYTFIARMDRYWEDEVKGFYGKTDEDIKLIDQNLDTRRHHDYRNFIDVVSGRRRVTVIEMQHKIYEDWGWATNGDQVVQNLTNLKEMEKLRREGWNVVRDRKPVVYTTRFVGHLILDHRRSYLDDQYSITRYSPYFAMGEDVSMTSQLKAQQLETNQNRTDMRELIGRAPKGLGFYTEESGLSKSQIETMNRIGGWHKVNNINGVKFEDTSSYFQALAYFAQMYQLSMKEFQEITGITDVLLGQLKSSTSGVVFNAARSQASLGLQKGIDNFNRTLHRHYQKLIPLIQKFFPTNKLLRITADQYEFLEKSAPGSRFLQVNLGAEEGSPAEIEAQDEYYEVLENFSRDLTLGQYDIYLEMGNNSLPQQQANFENLLKLISAQPQLGQFLSDIIVDYSGLPNKNIIKERIQQAQETLLQQQQQEMQLKAQQQQLQNQPLV